MNLETTITLIILISLALFFESKKDNIKQTKNIDYTKYKKKQYLLTKAELEFYKKIKYLETKKDIKIIPQVNLEQIINVSDNNYADRNRIKSRSIDFTIVSSKNLSIICCIELDDYTHNKYNRQNRDIFINNLFEFTNLKLYRYNLNTNIEEIEKNIDECLNTLI